MRELSIELTASLSSEDMTVQATEDASPTKWHLAHTTWFFETFALKPWLPGYRLFDDSFGYCFNSYYESIGNRHPRPRRGLLTRPPIERVLDYRRHVDAALSSLLRHGEEPELARLIEVGINHEQQHQELLLTDILALFSRSPLRPAYHVRNARHEDEHAHAGSAPSVEDAQWHQFASELRPVGFAGDGFAWDNERPRHDTFVHAFRLADRLITNAEWLEFMIDGGYREPLLWLADGWARVLQEGWVSPLYWEELDGQWLAMSLEGLQPIEPRAPVAHVSYFEADAFARWRGQRLPTEFEWEIASRDVPVAGNLLSTRMLKPTSADVSSGTLRQMFGDVWEWTQSAYLPYPGYSAPAGALGEYNGKFMVSQHVLRGGSCVTPADHIRPTYRNFFYPHQRWQFSGVRLASEAV